MEMEADVYAQRTKLLCTGSLFTDKDGNADKYFSKPNTTPLLLGEHFM